MLRYYIALSMMLFLDLLSAQETAVTDYWSNNTACLMPKGKWESGIYQPCRYGLTQQVELRSNLLLMPFLPNAGVKVAYGRTDGILWAGEHTLSYPTSFLKFVARKGIGGLISPQYEFPFILSVDNSLLATKTIRNSFVLTASAGFSFAIRDKKPDYQSTIDLPLFYPRMAHYYEGMTLRCGLSCKGEVIRRVFYEEGVRMFAVTRSGDNLFAENSGSVMWAISRSLRIKGGYVLSWGKYPFGNHIQLWPSLDLVFGSKR